MPRFFLSPEQWDAAQWELRGDEAKHCARVVRMKAGDDCVLFDGRGNAINAVIEWIEGSSLVRLIPGGMVSSSLDSLAAITLCQAIPKGSNMDWIIQKSVELGVSRIQPLLTGRTITRYTEKEAENKRSKWQRTALEACKQCGQNLVPVIELPQTFRSWIHNSLSGLPELRVIASLAPGAVPARECLEAARKRGERSAAYLVGPEGDFTPEEISAALDRGFSPVTLGPIVLRVETAALLGLSMIRYALDK